MEQRGAIETFKDTIEQLIIAFILAFVFRAFVVEAFVIPTGSMADTLRGAHFRLTCPECGYRYNFGFTPEYYGYPKGAIPPRAVDIPGPGFNAAGIPICQMCGAMADTTRPQRVSNGDRILVLKYLYQFVEPETWDVVVFKNPTQPEENFIKRLIGKPGEKVEIKDGDVYINDLIKRKPQYVQDALWIPVYDSDYPRNRAQGEDVEIWQKPIRPERSDSNWVIESKGRRFEFGGSDQFDVLAFDQRRIRKFALSFSAYNGQRLYEQSVVSDLKVEFVLIPQGNEGKVSVMLGKYERVYRADIGFDGHCTITDEFNNKVLAQKKFDQLAKGVAVVVSLALVDHSLKLSVGPEQLEHVGANDPREWGYDPRLFQLPSMALAGEGDAFTLEQVVLYRDVHYTNVADRAGPGRGAEDNPFTLQEDEFFVLGDNSPASHDSRFWERPGLGNGRKNYRAGVVPRDYLIGRALLVYWPGGFYPHQRVRFAIIPNAGQMRFIY